MSHIKEQQNELKIKFDSREEKLNSYVKKC